MPSSSEEAQALGHAEFWDERYAKADSDKPTHEWFRAFDELEPFFKKHLFDKERDEGKNAKILHLGSGDSVGSSSLQVWKAVGCTIMWTQILPFSRFVYYELNYGNSCHLRSYVFIGLTYC